MTKPTLTDLEIRHVLASMGLLQEAIPGGWHSDELQSAMRKLQQRQVVAGEAK